MSACDPCPLARRVEQLDRVRFDLQYQVNVLRRELRARDGEVARLERELFARPLPALHEIPIVPA